jgi:hypothetical protein
LSTRFIDWKRPRAQSIKVEEEEEEEEETFLFQPMFQVSAAFKSYLPTAVFVSMHLRPLLSHHTEKIYGPRTKRLTFAESRDATVL